MFAKVKGQFFNGNVKLNAEKVLIKSHLNKHFNGIKDLILEYNVVKEKLEREIDSAFTDVNVKVYWQIITKRKIKDQNHSELKKEIVQLNEKKCKGNVNYKVLIIN